MNRFADLAQYFQARVSALMTKNENQIFMVLTLVIGATVGLVIVGFIVITDSLEQMLYKEDSDSWRLLLTPILATLIAGVLIFRFFPEARGSGVPQTKATMFAVRAFKPMRSAMGKFIVSSLTLASGVTLGREGPSVQIGGGLAVAIGRFFGFTGKRIQMLVPVGAAAALAAAFNTPIAAVLFALEEIAGNLHAPILGSIVISAATSWLVLRMLLGDEPLFAVPDYEIVHPTEFLIYALLGIIGGFVSVLFVKGMLYLREHFLKMPRKTLWLQPAVGGLLVGVLAVALPGIFHFGYRTVGEALNGELPLIQMAVLVLLSVCATSVCYASGNAGGIFGPSLFIGAMVGGTVGSLANTFFPDYTATSGAYALVGMGTTFAGILRVPMVSVIMIFEITQNYTIIVPLMISNLISFFVSLRLQRKPIYEALALQEGIHLPTSESTKRHLQVRVAMRPPHETFTPDMTIQTCLDRAGHSSWRAWPVIGKDGLWGIVSLQELEIAHEQSGGDVRVSNLLDSQVFPHLHTDHSLDLALERMGKTGYDLLPVVSRTNVHDIEGVCSIVDVLRAFGVHGENRFDSEKSSVGSVGTSS